MPMPMPAIESPSHPALGINIYLSSMALVLNMRVTPIMPMMSIVPLSLNACVLP